ncbi:choice-of-anchor X domain-containing protein [Motilimonas sp. KMU-193]|uniref:choice-of-anchor X domain-containing protein n=1 Tax=Motilimonas sp. KMU-193 TaxID=3388668 RepID=UPI00396B01F9
MNNLMIFIFSVFLIALLTFHFMSNANNITPSSSVRDSLGYIDTPFKKEDTKTVVEFEVTQGQSFWSIIVIPITGARFELIAADGTVVFDNQHNDIKVVHGSDMRDGLAGVRYDLPLIDVANRTGTWQFVVQYDSPGYDSMIVTQIFKQMTVDAKVTIPGNLAVVGDLMAPSVIVKANGEGIPNADVSFLLTYPDGSTLTVAGYDNGLGFDGAAGDGVYSSVSTYPYQQLGEHLIEAKVTAQHLGYEYQTQAAKNIVVTEQLAIVNKTEVMIPQDSCAEEVILKANITVKKSGNYSIYNSLKGSLDNRFGIRVIQKMDLSQGEHDIELFYSKEALIKRFSQQEIISFSPLLIEIIDLDRAGTPGFNSVVNPRAAIADKFYLKESGFCRVNI